MPIKKPKTIQKSKSLYVAYAYEAADGTWGYKNIVLQGINDLESITNIAVTVQKIRERHPGVDLTEVTPINWWACEGTLDDISSPQNEIEQEL